MKLRKLFSIRLAIVVLWALALVTLVIIIGPARVVESYGGLTPHGIKASIDTFGIYSVIAFLAASMLRPLVFAPISPLTIASGFMFGMWQGLLWAMIGSTLSAIFVFFLSRYILHDLVTKRLQGRYPALDKMFKGRGWNFVLFLRMIPAMPFDAVSWFAGASHIRFRDYLIGTLIGELPGAVVLVMLGTSLENIGSTFFYLSLALAVAMFAATELARRWMGRRKWNASHDGPPPGKH